MGLEKKILYLVLSFLSIFLCFFPKKKHRVTFVSMTTDTLQGDFKQIAEELKKQEDIEIYTILTKYKKNTWGNLMYFMNCIKQLFIINTSKVVVLNDNNYVVSTFKKAYPTIIQIWHACGAVKKFGNDIEREYPIDHYDYVISTSDAWKEVFASSFHVTTDQVIPLGMARTDILCDEIKIKGKQDEFVKRYPILESSYVVLYAPTFRGNTIKGMRHVTIDLDAMIDKLPDNYVILYKMHPLLGDIEMAHHPRVINMNEEELYDLMVVSDCLISDYSSIIFDYSILLKKQIYYVPDEEEYENTIGLNVKMKEMPGAVCHTETEVLQALMETQDEKKEKIKRFRDRYFANLDGNSAKRIAEFIKNT